MKGHFRPDGGRFADARRAGGRTELAEKSVTLADFVGSLPWPSTAALWNPEMTSSRAEVVWIGTLSADGKLLQVATAGASFALQIAGDKMSGCGSGKTSDAKAFNAVCFEMAAVK
jgi:hypothetical protein